MKRILLGTLTALAMAVAQAEPMYISDKLVVNVYAEADQESSKVTTLDSGDAVEAIEKLETFTQVRLPDGREGWIKSSYLSAQAPAIVRLKQLEKEHAASAPAPDTQLSGELKQLREQNAALQLQLTAAKTAASQVRASAPAATLTAAPQAPQANEPTARNQMPSSSHAYTWAAGFALLGGAIGFLLGYQALARRIRRKYGSVKIY